MLHDLTARPYLVRAAYDFCVNEGYTPYLLVYVDSHVEVPMQFVRDNQIVLNMSPSSVAGLHIDNELIQFKARFSGVPKDIFVQIDHVLAIFARETNVGLTFPVNPADFDEMPLDKSMKNVDHAESQKKSSEPLTRPHLNRVK